MSSSNPNATVDNTTSQALYQLESMSSSLEEDPLVYFGIHDSLSLKQYAPMKLVRDDVSDGDQLDIDIEVSQQEVDRAWKAFDSSWEHDLAPPRPSTSPKRRGVRRGQHDCAEASTPATLTVMTKTHDGGCRGRDTSGFIVICNASAIVPDLNTASAA
eukprot:scaffold4441_cov145-Skeletonema_menzelii.AAC.4